MLVEKTTYLNRAYTTLKRGATGGEKVWEL
jgi:hypothetical protein